MKDIEERYVRLFYEISLTFLRGTKDKHESLSQEIGWRLRDSNPETPEYERVILTEFARLALTLI